MRRLPLELQTRPPELGHLRPAINYPYGMGPEAPCPWPCHYKPIYTIYGLRYGCDCSGSE